MGASWYSTVMEALPVVADGVTKLFPSKKALGAITSNPEAVSKGKDSYEKLSKTGSVYLYKQQVTGMDKVTLTKVVLTFLQNVNSEVTALLSVEMLKASATDEWMFSGNIVEELENSPSGTNFLFYKIFIDSKGKYNIAICHLQASCKITTDVLIGGLIAEGLLARDKDNRAVYLQF